MSEPDLERIKSIKGMVKWLLGGMGGMLFSAFCIGLWVANQQQEIRHLVEMDKSSVIDRAEIRGMIKAHSDVIMDVKQDTALQGRDITYIRQAVDKIELAIKRQ